MDQLCAQLSQLHAHSFTPVTKGEPINISADHMDLADYFWSGPNSFQSMDQDNAVTSSADFSNRGWYYLTMTYQQCEINFDSVYVDVKFPQGTPSCSPANNTATFNSPLLLGDQSFYSVSFSGSSGGYEIDCNSMNGDMYMYMSNYWSTRDLEDGVYHTTNTIPYDWEIDKIFISDINQSITWFPEENKPVYISHVGGKQRITFCAVDFSGDWGGTIYHATVDAQITQP